MTLARSLAMAIAILLCSAVFAPGVSATATSTGAPYTCRLAATRLGPRIDLRFRLRTSVARQRWRVRISVNGDRIYARTHSTNARGRAVARTLLRRHPGPDAFIARARNLRTGRVCVVKLTI